ncbi:MAG: L,D-transpeptidase family protein [Pseudomonadota bacterium]
MATLRLGVLSLFCAAAVVAVPATASAPQAPAAPFQSQVLALYDAYEAQLAIVRAGGWTRVPDTETLRPGMRAPAVIALRHRLAASGDAAAVPQPETLALQDYDEALAAAVAGFQRRHGLEADAVVGPATLRALNVSAPTRLRQLALNLERWQRLPIDDSGSMILVNVPEFRAQLFRNGNPDLSLRAVVGARKTPTPDLAEPLDRIVLNPSWFVPARIGRRELLPKVIADPGYLARNNYRAYADGEALPASAFAEPESLPEARSLRFRQEPGPQNALGRVKFVLPNERGIFLHDTASRDLFERSRRAFSHGCVRLETPLALVRTLLENEAGWSAQRVQSQLERSKTIHLKLAAPLPVYVQYLTARVIDGEVHYFDDIYRRDTERLANRSFEREWVSLLAALRKDRRQRERGDLLAERARKVLPPTVAAAL